MDAASSPEALFALALQKIAELNATQQAQAQEIQQFHLQVESNLDDSITSFIVNEVTTIMFMQLGFALLEAGCSLPKNIMTILFKNFCDFAVCTMAYYVLCSIFASMDIMIYPTFPHVDDQVSFVMSTVYAGTFITIVSGATAARSTIEMHLIVTLFISVVIYPLIIYVIWTRQDFFGAENMLILDYAGGFCVHGAGGFAALICAYLLGPRKGRFRQSLEGELIDDAEQGHSVIVYTMGVFILWVAWFPFNLSGSAATTNVTGILGTVVVNTVLGGCLPLVIDYGYTLWRKQNLSLWRTGNLCLSGLVMVTAGAGFLEPWSVFLLSVLTVISYRGVSRLMVKFQIDDVVDAVAVHAVNGYLGGILLPLFTNKQRLADFGYDVTNYHWAEQCGIQILAALYTMAVVVIVLVPVLKLGNWFNLLHAAEIDQVVGLDFKYMKGYAYPDFNMLVVRAKKRMDMEKKVALRMQKTSAGNFDHARNLNVSRLPAPSIDPEHSGSGNQRFSTSRRARQESSSTTIPKDITSLVVNTGNVSPHKSVAIGLHEFKQADVVR